MEIITPARARIALVVLAFIGGCGAGGGIASVTQEPEVITVSEDVPSACADAARSGTAALAAWENIDQSETKASTLAGALTVAGVAADDEAQEAAIDPIAGYNAKTAKTPVTASQARPAQDTPHT